MGLSLLATTDTQIIRLVEALYKQTPGYTYLTNFRTFTTENGIDGFANSLAGNFGSSTDAELAAIVTANLGLTGDGLAQGNTYLEAQFAAAPAARGEAILAAMNLLSGMESDPVFGAVAVAFNNNTVASLTYSTVIANTTILAAGVGQTFSLTTSTDSTAIVGTTKADVYNAIVDLTAATDTLTSGDTINAGAGEDTLNVTATGTGDVTVTGVSSDGLESIVITNLDTGTTNTLTVDAATMTGLTNITVNNSTATGEVAFTNLKAAVAATMSANPGDLTLTYLAAVTAGTTDTQALSVSGANGTFTADGFETIAITTTGSAATLANVTSDAVTQLTVAGDQNLTLTAAEAIKTIDASALTGNLTMTAAAAAQTITGGTGDDSFDMVGTLDKLDTIDGGAGIDTLKLSVAGQTIDNTALTGELINVSNIEVIDIASTANTAVLDLDGVTGVTTLNAASNVGVFGVAGSSETDGDTVTFILNGTSYTTAAVDSNAYETIVATKINTIDGFSAVATTNIVTITNTSATSEAVEFGTMTVTGSGTVATTSTTGYPNVSFINMAGTETLNVYSADTVTTGLKDASGTSDAMTINLATLAADKGFNKTVGDIVVANVETVNLDSTGLTAGITNTLSDLSADATLTTLTITGDSNLTITTTSGTSKLATVNASALTGDFAYTSAVATLAETITTGSGNDTIAMAGNLTALDVIDAGANTVLTDGTAGKDTLTATINALGTVSTVAALSIANVETITFNTDTAASVINAAGITGNSTIELTASQNVTMTNIAAGTSIQLGSGATEYTAGTLDLSLADETGTADAITLAVTNSADGTSSATMKVSATVETLNVVASTEADNAEATNLTNTLMLATNVVVTKGAAADTLALGTLSTSTTNVDASGYDGILTATGSATATTFTLKGGAIVHDVTGGLGNDTVTVAKTTAQQNLDGGAGTDTLNLTLDGTVSADDIANFEVINYTVTDGATGVLTTASGAGVNDNDTTTVTVSGGNSLTTFTHGAATAIGAANGTQATGLVTYNLSAFTGLSSGVTFGLGVVDANLTITGSAGTADTVITTYANVATLKAMTGVENFNFTSTAATAAANINMKNVDGVTKMTVANTTNASVTILTDLDSGVALTFTGATTEDGLTVDLIDKTLLTNTQTITLSEVAGANNDVNINASDIETLTLVVKDTTGAHEMDIDLSTTLMSTAGKTSTLIVTATTVADLIGVNADITTIDASMSTAAVKVLAAARGSSAMTITGGTGNDSIAMENENDVLNAGELTGDDDTLIVAYTSIMSGIQVNLSGTTDQVVSLDNSANSAIQVGFESVDVSAYLNNGAIILGSSTANTITGTASVDNINAGAGDDEIMINIGTVADDDVMNGGAGSDTLSIAAGLTVTIDGDTDLENVEIIAFEAAGTVVLTGQTEAFTITDVATDLDNVITGGSGIETFASGHAADSDQFIFATTAAANGVDALSGFTLTDGEDILNFGKFIGTLDTTAATNDQDSINVSISDSLDFNSNTVNVIVLNDIQTLTTANFGAQSATKIALGDADVVAIIADVAGDSDDIMNIYYVTAAADGDSTSAGAASVTLVGTINEDGLSTIDQSNFLGS